MNPIALWNGLVALLLVGTAGLGLWWFPVGWLTSVVIMLPLPVLYFLWRWMSKAARSHLRIRSRLRSLQDPVKLEQLKRNLKALGAHRSVEQMGQLSSKFEDLEKVLKLQFHEDELTFVRYRQSAETVRISVLENVRETEVALNSIRSIEVGRLKEKLVALQLRTGQRALAERETLQRRLDMYDQQSERVEKLLLENETALTALSNTAVALADIKVDASGEKQDAEVAIAELERMARRAARYQPGRQ
ncbi:MAG: hypothetical protein GY703_11320 [Gammaproteobacteria bacterium]|nr:hypothetical protein [Gammaproteobacteria bacterium]